MERGFEPCLEHGRYSARLCAGLCRQTSWDCRISYLGGIAVSLENNLEDPNNN
jgi:hypothetical protein